MTIRTTILGIIAALLLCVSAHAHDYPHELVGEWVRRHTDSTDLLYVNVNNGFLSIENHLDGEGYACNLPIANLITKRTKERADEIISTSGNAVCQAEENPREKHIVYLLYSNSRSDHTETLVFVGWGSTEILKRH